MAIRRMLVCLCLCLGAVGCVAPEVPYQCATWCDPSAADVFTIHYVAVDELDASEQCFDQLGGVCSNGRLRKCMCTLEP